MSKDKEYKTYLDAIPSDQKVTGRRLIKLLWLDDFRDPFMDNWLVFSPVTPDSVYWVKSYDEFTAWIERHGLPDAICFDHDLGMPVAIEARSKGMSKRESRKLKAKEKTGYDCAKWLVDRCMKFNRELPLYNIQSANHVGKENIDNLLKNYIKHYEQASSH